MLSFSAATLPQRPFQTRSADGSPAQWFCSMCLSAGGRAAVSLARGSLGGTEAAAAAAGLVYGLQAAARQNFEKRRALRQTLLTLTLACGRWRCFDLNRSYTTTLYRVYRSFLGSNFCPFHQSLPHDDQDSSLDRSHPARPFAGSEIAMIREEIVFSTR